MHNFGKNLARFRKSKGLSQGALAEQSGAVQSSIGDLDTGRTNSSWEFAHKVVRFFT